MLHQSFLHLDHSETHHPGLKMDQAATGMLGGRVSTEHSQTRILVKLSKLLATNGLQPRGGVTPRVDESLFSFSGHGFGGKLLVASGLNRKRFVVEGEVDKFEDFLAAARKDEFGEVVGEVSVDPSWVALDDVSEVASIKVLFGDVAIG